MQHVVTTRIEPVASASGALEIHGIPAWQDNLVWLLVDRATGEAAAVDGPEASATLAYVTENGFRLTTILNTHTHGDHIGINRDLQKRGALESMQVFGAAKKAGEIPGLTHPLGDGDRFRLFGKEVSVMLTEGHIDGHISFLVDGALFPGDTLFGGGCGYLFDGPPAKMHASLARLSALPDDTLVFPAHEYTEDNLRFAFSVEPENPSLVARIRETRRKRERGECTLPSSIGLEKATNPFLRTGETELVGHVAHAMQKDLETDLEVFTATRALKDRKDYRSLPDASLPR